MVLDDTRVSSTDSLDVSALQLRLYHNLLVYVTYSRLLVFLLVYLSYVRETTVH